MSVSRRCEPRGERDGSARGYRVQAGYTIIRSEVLVIGRPGYESA